MRAHGKIIAGTTSAVVVASFAAWGIGYAASAPTHGPTPTADLGAGPAIAETNPSTGRKVKADALDNVEKGPGQQAGLFDEQTKTSYFTIEVTDSEVVDDCTPRVGTDKLRPIRTAFLVLEVSASLADSVAEKAGGGPEDLFMPLVAEAFSVSNPGGEVDRNVTSETAWGCFDDAQLLPPVVNPGQSVSGKVGLDVGVPRGRVAYDPEDNGGWSWPYGG